MRFNDACEAKTHFPQADFWIVAQGPKLGDAVKAYAPGHIGIRVKRTDLLLPNFLYYLMVLQKQQGVYTGERQLCPSFFHRITFDVAMDENAFAHLVELI